MLEPDTSITVQGIPLSLPIMAAPIDFQTWFHPEGELASVRCTGQASTLYVASSSATTSLEDIAKASSCPIWFQLYLYQQRAVSEHLVKRAEQAGYQAIVITADTAYYGRKEKFLRNNFSTPEHVRKANLSDDADGQASSEYGWDVFD